MMNNMKQYINYDWHHGGSIISSDEYKSKKGFFPCTCGSETIVVEEIVDWITDVNYDQTFYIHIQTGYNYKPNFWHKLKYLFIGEQYHITSILDSSQSNKLSNFIIECKQNIIDYNLGK